MSRARPGKATWRQIALIVALAPVLLAVVAVAGLFFAASTVLVHAAMWIWWSPRGREVLFVYSDSPVWCDHIEQRVLPYLGERAVVLNWSRRKRWRVSIATLAFRHFGGYRQFNPLAVVFRPFRRTRTFRFWEPFKALKHGRPEALHEMEDELFRSIGIQGREPST